MKNASRFGTRPGLRNAVRLLTLSFALCVCSATAQAETVYIYWTYDGTQPVASGAITVPVGTSGLEAEIVIFSDGIACADGMSGYDMRVLWDGGATPVLGNSTADHTAPSGWASFTVSTTDSGPSTQGVASPYVAADIGLSTCPNFSEFTIGTLTFDAINPGTTLVGVDSSSDNAFFTDCFGNDCNFFDMYFEAAQVTVVDSSTTTTTLPGAVSCPGVPQAPCLEAGAATFQYSEKKAGKEKAKFGWKKIVSATAQMDFADPVNGSTSTAVCIYNDAGGLIEDLGVNRAGLLCAGKPCWKLKGSKGYQYKDKDALSDGIVKIGYVSGDAGKGKVAAGGKNNEAKGQTHLPTGVTAALQAQSAPTIQLITSDGFCVQATMDKVIKQDPLLYKAQSQTPGDTP